MARACDTVAAQCADERSTSESPENLNPAQATAFHALELQVLAFNHVQDFKVKVCGCRKLHGYKTICRLCTGSGCHDVILLRQSMEALNFGYGSSWLCSPQTLNPKLGFGPFA